MYSIGRSVDISSMKCLGIITANERNLYRNVQSYIFNKGITPTEFFYNKLKSTCYGASGNPILSMLNDESLIVAKKDDDAIFLYSEDKILSPTQLINCFVNLYDAAKNANTELSRAIYSNFGITDLKINFVNMNMLTGMTPDVVEQSCINFKKIGDSKVFLEGELNNVKVLFNGNTGKVEYEHISQYGMNLMSFLDTLINLNPDIRLLMSNTSVTLSRNTLVDAFLNTVRHNYSSYKNYSDMEIAQDIHSLIGTHNFFEGNEKTEFFEAFAEEQKRILYRIRSANQKYKVFTPLKYVLGLQQSEENRKSEDLDTKYMLRWYEGDPDNGARAINYALDIISKTISSEREIQTNACRNLQPVKDYMKVIKERTFKMNKESKSREEKNKMSEDYTN